MDLGVPGSVKNFKYLKYTGLHSPVISSKISSLLTLGFDSLFNRFWGGPVT